MTDTSANPAPFDLNTLVGKIAKLKNGGGFVRIDEIKADKTAIREYGEWIGVARVIREFSFSTIEDVGDFVPMTDKDLGPRDSGMDPT